MFTSSIGALLPRRLTGSLFLLSLPPFAHFIPMLAQSVRAALPASSPSPPAEGRKRGWTPGPRLARCVYVLHGCMGTRKGHSRGQADEHKGEKRRTRS